MALYVKFECSTCENKNCTGHGLPTTEKVCDGYKHTTTNADHIRNMTDEELATFLNDDWHDLPECRRRAYNPEYGSEECYAPDCKDCWLDWLQQEVSDGN